VKMAGGTARDVVSSLIAAEAVIQSDAGLAATTLSPSSAKLASRDPHSPSASNPSPAIMNDVRDVVCIHSTPNAE